MKRTVYGMNVGDLAAAGLVYSGAFFGKESEALFFETGFCRFEAFWVGGCCGDPCAAEAEVDV